MEIKELNWKAPDGIQIFARYFGVDSPKAALVMVHGMGEHSGRYIPYASYLNSRNISVLVYDHRGHGKSEGKRGHTPSYEILLEEVNNALKHLKELCPDVPIFIFGHSMGGNVVLNYALRRKPKVSGIIASAPWLKLAFDPPAIQVALAKMVKNIIPALQQHTKLDATAISSISAEVEKYKNDPLIHDYITPAFFMGTYEAADWALQHAADITLPLYLYHGSHDKLISVEGSKQFAQKAGKLCTLTIFENQFHESHYDTKAESVMKATADWILDRTQS